MNVDRPLCYNVCLEPRWSIQISIEIRILNDLSLVGVRYICSEMIAGFEWFTSEQAFSELQQIRYHDSNWEACIGMSINIYLSPLHVWLSPILLAFSWSQRFVPTEWERHASTVSQQSTSSSSPAELLGTYFFSLTDYTEHFENTRYIYHTSLDNLCHRTYTM